MQKLSYRIINGITLYRIVITPVLLFLIFTTNLDVFKWFLAISFFTDFIDGFLARIYKVTSKFGSKLDSIGDDLTILCGAIGLFVFKLDFLQEQAIIIGIMLGLFLLQNALAFIRYRKMTSFHTYLAKFAAIAQGVFLILTFFLPEPVYFIFYVACAATILDLIEEIIIVLILPEWKINVKGLYWILKSSRNDLGKPAV